jgi:diguanylate cyclase (GGDEF)-like protein
MTSALPAGVLASDEAVELAPRVWWVGSLLPDDEFQCHVYLIEQGDQSVLLDPGSLLAAESMFRKVDGIVGIENVRWLVCSHSDPDIIAALPALVARGLHRDAAIVTHWRDEALIRHFAPTLPYWRIEEHAWRLTLADRELQFLFTPYAHSAGAFCTFDPVSGTAFTSDLFGGFDRAEAKLFATSMDDFEALRRFHEHYMPSREILNYSLQRIAQLPLSRIAPQHGFVIEQPLVRPMLERLGELECGVYLLAHDDPGLDFLLEANRTLRDVVRTLVIEARFPVVARRLADIANQFLGANRLEFWARAGTTLLHFEPGDGYAGAPGSPEAGVQHAFDGDTIFGDHELVVPLRARSTEEVLGVVVLGFDERPSIDAATVEVMNQIAELVEVGLEREVMRRVAALDRDAFYEQATHDALTGLYNRAYVTEVADHLCALDDRNSDSQLAALMVDLDHFKAVNDELGHAAGDAALRAAAAAVARVVRPGDVAVRFGGEEFLVLLSAVRGRTAIAVAERIRAAIARTRSVPAAVTASVGIAMRHPGEGFEDLVARADGALYRAKIGGRDRLDVAP